MNAEWRSFLFAGDASLNRRSVHLEFCTCGFSGLAVPGLPPQVSGSGRSLGSQKTAWVQFRVRKHRHKGSHPNETHAHVLQLGPLDCLREALLFFFVLAAFVSLLCCGFGPRGCFCC